LQPMGNCGKNGIRPAGFWCSLGEMVYRNVDLDSSPSHLHFRVAVSVAEPRPVLERYVNLGVTVGETILVACFVSMLLVTKWLRLSTESPGRAGQQMMLWIAQGFGVGRVPVAPGTVGSVLGIVWFALLAATGRVWAVILGTVLGLGLSIWLCGVAESML